MGQVTIYLDPETENRMRAAAKGAGLSQSKWVANLIRERTETAWPTEEIREGLSGGVKRERL